MNESDTHDHAVAHGLPTPSVDADGQLRTIESLVGRLAGELSSTLRSVPSTHGERITELAEMLSAAALHAARSAAGAASELSAQRSSPRLFELDALTELPNRALFRDRLSQALAHARRRGTRLGVLFIDLDQFKSINDRHGHAVGDHVIRLVARRLTAVVRDGDTVSRYGGDEFLVLLSEVSDAADAATLAGVVQRALSGPLGIGDDVIELRASIGVSVFPEDGRDHDTLVQHADEAMFVAKRRANQALETRGDTAPALPAREAGRQLAHPPTLADAALLEAEHRIHRLRVSNEQLLLNALVATDLQQRAERAASEQAELLSVSAHELRGSLFALQTAAETLVLTQADVAHLPRLTLVLRRQIANISRITGDLLDVARLNSGRLTLHCVPVDACRLIADVLEDFPHRAGPPAIEVDASAKEGGMMVTADAARLRQVLQALLTVLGSRVPTPGQIRVSTGQENGKCRITLLATGPVSSSQEIALRSAVPAPGDDASPRSTLGLSLVLIRQLLRAHDGSLTFEHDQDTGGVRCLIELPDMDSSKGSDAPT